MSTILSFFVVSGPVLREYLEFDLKACSHIRTYLPFVIKLFLYKCDAKFKQRHEITYGSVSPIQCSARLLWVSYAYFHLGLEFLQQWHLQLASIIFSTGCNKFVISPLTLLAWLSPAFISSLSEVNRKVSANANRVFSYRRKLCWSTFVILCRELCARIELHRHSNEMCGCKSAIRGVRICICCEVPRLCACPIFVNGRMRLTDFNDSCIRAVQRDTDMIFEVYTTVRVQTGVFWILSLWLQTALRYYRPHF
jgi:hypothetical protein